MKKNINYKRVRRIKAAIYLFLLLLILIPAILMIVVGVKILGRLDSGNAASLSAIDSPTPAGAAAPGGNSREESFLLDGRPVDSSVTQLPVPEASSLPEESGDMAGGSREASPGGVAAQASQGFEPQSSAGEEESSSAVDEPLPGQAGGGEGGGLGASDIPTYGDTEIPNTGFPKPGEMAPNF